MMTIGRTNQSKPGGAVRRRFRVCTASFGALALGAFLGFAPICGSVFADSAASITSLDEAKTRALLRNPGVKAAFESWRAAAARGPQARALPDPMLTYSYYIEEVETRVGPQEQALGVRQTVPWFGKRALRGEAADAGALAARRRYEQAKLDLVYDVKTAYYDLYYLHKAIDVTRRNMELLESLEKVAQSRYKTGGAMLPLVQLQTELGKLEDRVKELEALLPARVARLNAVLDRPPEAEVAKPTRIDVPDDVLDTSRLRRQLTANSPRLKRLDSLARKHEHKGKLAEKQRRPDVSFGLKSIDTGGARNPATPGSGTDPVMATVSVNLPIWRSKYDAAEEEAERNRWAALHQKAEARNQLVARLDLALFHYRDAGRKINLYQDTLIPKAKQVLEVAKQAFETGEAEFLSLIDAERTLLEFELQHEQARTERARRRAEIEQLVGEEIPPNPTPTPGDDEQ